MRAAVALLSLIVLAACQSTSKNYLLVEPQLEIPIRLRPPVSEAPAAFELSPAARIKGEARVLVDLRVQVDLDRLAARLRERRFTKLQRRRICSKALRHVAERSQKKLHPFFEELRRRGWVKSYRGFSIVNSVLIEVRPQAVAKLIEHPDVAAIVEETESPLPIWAGTTALPAESSRESWVISSLEADLVWADGLTGVGALVAAVDSGASATHEQLRANYVGGERGWFDPGEGAAQPRDGAFGHGTGVLSCAVGANVEGKTLGIAPSARWAACRALPDGRFNNVLLMECADWILNIVQPDIVVNTWLFPESGCDASARSIVEAWRTAEMLPVFAAGNSGPEPGVNASPSNYVGLSPGAGQALSVGGLSAEEALYQRSARGPNACDGSVFPSLVAPADKVLAALPLTASSYIEAEGTSFAAGLVAGVAALLVQRYPEASVAQLEEALRRGTNDLGPPGPDNDFGHGRLNVPRALEELGMLMETAQ